MKRSRSRGIFALVLAVLGNATSPAGLTAFEGYSLGADPLFPVDPGGRLYPALVPGYGDSNNVPSKQWGWGCLFRAGQPPAFHSGRNYGVHRAATVGGVRRTVLVAGSPVGNLDDPYCNVSRWTGILQQNGSPATRALAWKLYEGFHSNNWTSFPWVPPGGEAPTPSRWGNFMDRCLHLFGDARTVMDGQNTLLVNYFTVDWANPAAASAHNDRIEIST